jgi:murein L,D-transpeptidase YafK
MDRELRSQTGGKGNRETEGDGQTPDGYAQSH